nr:MAG TPA: hypothetical protein [Caudoviricetes sp.]
MIYTSLHCVLLSCYFLFLLLYSKQALPCQI